MGILGRVEKKTEKNFLKKVARYMIAVDVRMMNNKKSNIDYEP